MAKTILITFTGKDNVSKTAAQVETAVAKIGKQATKTTTQISKGFTNVKQKMSQIKLPTIAIDQASQLSSTVKKLGTTVSAATTQINKVFITTKKAFALIKLPNTAVVKTNKLTTAVQTLGKTSTNVTAKMKGGFEDVETQLNRMGNKFRFMSIAFTMLAAGAVVMGKSFVTAAAEMEAATMKLGVFAAVTGENFKEVNQAAMKLASTGLISVTEAADSFSNALGSGLGLDKSIKLMNTFLNAASVAKTVLTDTVGMAVNKAMVGFRTLREIQIDNVGIQANLNQVWSDYAVSIDKVRGSLTLAEKYEAMYLYYMEKGAKFTGAADMASKTFSGTLSRLGTSMTIMKASIGAALIPLIGTLADLFIKVSIRVVDFAEKFPALTSVIITGTIAFSVLAASLAAVGAIVPLVSTGLKVLGFTTLKTMIPTLLTLSLKFIGISIAIGIVGYAILKLTKQWDKWINAAKNMTKNIAEIFHEATTGVKTLENATKQLVSSLETIEKHLRLTYRSFTENLAKWAQQHRETMTSLRTDIFNLEKDYKRATNDISQNYKNMMSDLTLGHTRKTEDLQREIDEEVSKGIWADQSRIRDLKLRLKRENEDYALASTKNEKIRKDDLAEEKTEYNTRLAELQKELDKELAMEKKHANAIAAVKDVVILDEIEQRTRAFNEKIEQLSTEYDEVQKTSAATIAANNAVAVSNDTIADSLDGVNDSTITVSESTKQLEKDMALLSTTGGTAAYVLKETLQGVGDKITWVKDKYVSAINLIGGFIADAHEKSIENRTPVQQRRHEESARLNEERRQDDINAGVWISDFLRGMGLPIPATFPILKDGGVIPGATNQAIPIIAHGGETVLPAGVAPITVNINNPSVRSDVDIRNIAMMVKDVLSTQQRYRHIT